MVLNWVLSQGFRYILSQKHPLSRAINPSDEFICFLNRSIRLLEASMVWHSRAETDKFIKVLQFQISFIFNPVFGSTLIGDYSV